MVRSPGPGSTSECCRGEEGSLGFARAHDALAHRVPLPLRSSQAKNQHLASEDALLLNY